MARSSGLSLDFRSSEWVLISQTTNQGKCGSSETSPGTPLRSLCNVPHLSYPVSQTTERYLGCKQRIRGAVNDHIGIEPIN